MAKRRTRRLRKKLHIGEFQELGFSVKVSFKQRLNPKDAESFVDAFLAEAVEPRGLVFGGWAQGGFITREGRGSVTEAERGDVLAWLKARPQVAEVSAGELVDAWYYEESEDAL